MEWIDKDPIDPILPQEGWLHDYVIFSSGLEACTRFRFFTACCILGAAINNKVWIRRGNPVLLPRLMPNPWVILIAPPGRGHKSSTLWMGVNCLIEACPETRILADKITPEALLKALSFPKGEKEKLRIGPRDATGFVKASEIAVFFGKEQYNQGLVSLITDLYDWRERWSSETIMRGQIELRNNCLSMGCATTPDWMAKMLPKDAFTGGFLARYILVEMPSNYLKRVPDPEIKGEKTWGEIVQGLRELGRTKGEMPWEGEAKDYYDHIYREVKPTGNSQMDAYLERSIEQVLRIAAQISISQDGFRMEIKNIKHAEKILDFLMQETSPRIDALTTHPKMQLTQEIRTILRVKGPQKRSHLLRSLMKDLSGGEQQFLEALRVLCMSREVIFSGSPNDPTYQLAKKGDLD